MDPSLHLFSNQSPSTTAEHVIMHDKPYHEAAGTLNWAALTTCPNITFVVATVARSTANPSSVH